METCGICLQMFVLFLYRTQQKQTGRHGKVCTQVQNHTPTKSQLTETNKKMSLHLVEPPFTKVATFRHREDMRKKKKLRANHTQCCKFEHWQNNFTVPFPLHFHMCSIRRYVLRVHWLFVRCHCGDKKLVFLASWPSLRRLATHRGQQLILGDCSTDRLMLQNSNQFSFQNGSTFNAVSILRTLTCFPKLAQRSIPQQVCQTLQFLLCTWGHCNLTHKRSSSPQATRIHTTAVQNILVEDYDLHTVLSVWLLVLTACTHCIFNEMPNYRDRNSESLALSCEQSMSTMQAGDAPQSWLMQCSDTYTSLPFKTTLLPYSNVQTTLHEVLQS